MTAIHSLSTFDAYERWASNYPPVPHNPLMRAEQTAMLELWPAVAGHRALDLACGTGRYARLLTQGNARDVCAVDFSAAMLRQVATDTRVRADMMQLPFAASTFDIVISGLALGHARELSEWMQEVSRVLVGGGVFLYSDFHPEAAHAGLTRTFKDEANRSIQLSHSCYDLPAQRRAIADAHLTLEVVREVRVGIEFQDVFPGSEAFFRQWHGLPLVLVVRARK